MPSKKTTKKTEPAEPTNLDQYGVSFDPFERSDKLAAWLKANPGQIPAGMSQEDVDEALRPLDDPE